MENKHPGEPEPQTIYSPLLVHDRQIWGPRVFVTAPLAWLAQGLLLAVERFRLQASLPHEIAREVGIPLFEALQWAVVIDEYLSKRGRPTDSSLEALRFVRNRTHHQAASALYRDVQTRDWRWRPAANLPPAEEERFSDPKGQRAYSERLAEQPVIAALEAAAEFARLLEPNGDNS